MSKKARYYWGCLDHGCVEEFDSRESAERHVATCTGVLVVARDERPWEVVDE